MAKFKFKMQKLLDVKDKIKDKKEGEFASARKKLNIEKKKKEEVLKKIDEYMNLSRQASESNLSLKKLMEFKNYINFLCEKKEKIQQKINEKQKNVDIKKEELLEAVKERDILKKLKEKKLIKFKENEKKLEQSRTDEIISYKYNKQDK